MMPASSSRDVSFRLSGWRGVLVFVGLAVWPLASVAQTTFVSNLDNASSGGEFVFETQWFAGAFTTGAHAGGYALDNVDIAFTGVATDPTFAVSLWSDADEAPNLSLASLTFSSGIQFDALSSVALAPSSTYWLVLSSGEEFMGDSSYAWRTTADSSFAVSGGWSVAGSFAQSTDQGALWTLLPSDYVFAVTATSVSAVPEPSTYAVVVGGFVMAGAVCTRRRMRAKGVS